MNGWYVISVWPAEEIKLLRVGFNVVSVLQRRPRSAGGIITTLQNYNDCLFSLFDQLFSPSHLIFFFFSFSVLFCLCLISSQMYSLCNFVTESFTEQKRWIQTKSGEEKHDIQYFSCAIFPLSLHTRTLQQGVIKTRLKNKAEFCLVFPSFFLFHLFH